MISGIHALIYTPEADAVRAFFRDVLGFGSVDAGHGWLIFALPPAELGVHPSDSGKGTHTALHLMCDDLQATLAKLREKGVEPVRPVHEAEWGSVTAIPLPGGGEIGLYQPKHPTALHLPR
jgi:predicted enzyme related to lactoylglutathione lyase